MRIQLVSMVFLALAACEEPRTRASADAESDAEIDGGDPIDAGPGTTKIKDESGFDLEHVFLYVEELYGHLSFALDANSTRVTWTADTWFDEGGEIEEEVKAVGVATKLDDEWTEEIVQHWPWDSSASTDASSAMGPNGAAWISFYDPVTLDLGVAVKQSGEETWTISTVDAVGDVGVFPNTGVDASGTVWISYFDRTNGDLKVAMKPATGDWSTEVIDGNVDAGPNASIAVSNEGTVWLAYVADTSLRVASKALDGDWSTSMIDTSGDEIEHASIAVREDDKVQIAYWTVWRDDRDSQLRLASRSGGKWAVERVTEGSWGGKQSITIDETGAVWILQIGSYPNPDEEENEDWFATGCELLRKSQDGSWVRRRGDSGDYWEATDSSLAIGPDGSIHVACVMDFPDDYIPELYYARLTP